MNNKKILTISLVALGLAGAGFGVYWYLRKKSKKVVEETETNNNTTNVIIGASRNDDFPLKKGSKGERVKMLQEFINIYAKMKNISGVDLKPDGDFGSGTEAALQKVFGLKQIDRTQWNEAAMAYEKYTGKKLPFIF
jgi:hypothetical protein